MTASPTRRIAAIFSLAIATAAIAHAPACAAPAAHARESREIITRDNAVLILVDHQPQTIFGIASHDRQVIIHNVEALAKTAKAFGLPTILTTVSADAFTGPLIPEIRRVFPDQEVYDRSSLNAWADPRIVDAHPSQLLDHPARGHGGRSGEHDPVCQLGAGIGNHGRGIAGGRRDRRQRDLSGAPPFDASR